MRVVKYENTRESEIREESGLVCVTHKIGYLITAEPFVYLVMDPTWINSTPWERIQFYVDSVTITLAVNWNVIVDVFPVSVCFCLL